MSALGPNFALKDLTGTRIGRFEIRARIGAGGMGEVYRAEDTKLKREVALKRLARHLRGDERYHRNFLREAEQASALNCPYIASIYDVFEQDGELFLVMEYVEGVNLRARLGRSITLSEFLELAIQCAEALVAAHEKGIVHRDIKPENIMVTPAGRVKVLDFGLAKRMNLISGSTDTQSVGFVGTPGYMAPEVLLETKPDERADIFSLGIVFYEMATGHHPFQTSAMIRTTDRILHDEAPPLHDLDPTLPAVLEHILARMLAKQPADRYASASDLLNDLRSLQLQTASGAKLKRVAPRRRWVKPLLVTVAAAALAGAVVAGVPWLRDRLANARVSLPAGTRYVAVLPFRLIGADAADRAFADGLTETVTAKLTQFTTQHGLQVAPASEVHARKVNDIESARKELGVNLVLDGSVHRVGEIVRITLSLVDVRSGRQIQADTITAPESEAFDLEDRVVASVASMFQVQLAPAERRSLAVADTRSPQAHDAYLEARGYLQNYDKAENLERAIAGLKRATAADPNFALAYALLGEAYWRKFDVSRDTQWIVSGRSNCERALGINPNLAEARTCMGMLEIATGQYEGAVADFQRVLDTDPTSDSAYRGLAMAYEDLGKYPEAEATYRKAIALRPQYWGAYNWLGTFFFRHARTEDAIREFARVIELVPDSSRGYTNTAAAYLATGRYQDAIPFLEKAVSLDPQASAYSNLGVAYFYLRRYDQAAAAYARAAALHEKDYIPWGNLAEAYYWAGKRDQATAAYTKAISYATAQINVNARDVAALGALAQYHAMLGDAADARRFAERAFALAPSDPSVIMQRAIVFVRLGDNAQAVAMLDKALSLGLDPSLIRNNPVFDGLKNDSKLHKAMAVQAAKEGNK
jgi:tetratricopeptide (TPR) repeat protein/TolB-like protein/predicted Ser/Thr protein kinase